MKPPAFDFVAPRSLDEAVEVLRQGADDAKVLAGGQSLIPLLNMRLARPRVLIDLNRIAELVYVREEDGWIAIGAMTRQRYAERAILVQRRCPLLAEALPYVAHPAIRNRGTVGGSIAHNDPSAELGAVATCLGAQMVIRGPGGQRTASSEEFFLGYFTTSLGAGEVLAEVRFPTIPRGTGWAFVEVSRRHGDFALVAVACMLALHRGRISRTSIALAGVAGVPFNAEALAAIAVGEPPGEVVFKAIGQAVAGAVDPDSDIHASAEYRRHLAGVLTERSLTAAWQRAGGDSAA